MTGWWYTYPSEKYEAVGMMTFPTECKVKKSCSKQYWAIFVATPMSLVLDHETYSSIFPLKKMHLLWKHLSESMPIKMQKDGSNSYGGATEWRIIHRTCGPGPRWGHHQVILPSETSIHCSVQNPTCHPFFDWLIQNGIALMDMSPGPGPHPWYGPHMAEPPIYTLFAACWACIAVYF